VIFLKNFRLKAANYSLKKKLKAFSREREGHNFESAKTAGILFTPTDTVSFEQIKHFLSYLNNHKMQIYVLGYIDNNKIPESFLFWKGINLFSKKELNWKFIPNTPVVSDFIDKPFDLLFDLSLNDYFPVQYIARLSKSKCKIGRFTQNHSSYDLMFELNDQQKLDSYLDNIKQYLAMIN
jgi:hypothetical protein